MCLCVYERVNELASERERVRNCMGTIARAISTDVLKKSTNSSRSPATQVDYAVDVFKQLYPDDPDPEGSTSPFLHRF